jgi:predicted nucleic acid-binding protein
MTNAQLVVEASIVAKAYLKDEAFVDLAEALLDDFARGRTELFAPQLILYEIPSALEKAVRRGRISVGDGHRAAAHFLELGIVTVGDSDTLPQLIYAAYKVGQRLGCRIYDALYLVVADGLSFPFLTADRRLYDLAHGEFANLIWIEDYEREIGSSA